MKLYKCGDKIYSPIEAGPWQGFQSSDVVETKTVHHLWTGHTISITQWQEALAFLEWSYQETKSETVINLYYHDDLGWKFIVFPQKGYTGMAIDIIQDHPNRAILQKEHLGPGWEMNGTIHHHCSGSAFQSGHDFKDELGKEGLHITMGNMGADTYSLDARACFRNTITPIYLSDWFDVPQTLLDMAPEKNKWSWAEQWLQSALVKPAKGVTFPEFWKDQIIKVQPTYTPYTPQSHASNCSGSNGGSLYDQNRTPEHYKRSNWGWGKRDFQADVKKLFGDYMIDCEFILELLQQMSAQPCCDLVDAMSDNQLDIQEAIDAIQELYEDEKKRISDNSNTDNELGGGNTWMVD